MKTRLLQTYDYESFDRDLNVAETGVLILENDSDSQNRNILGCWFQICKIFSVNKSLKSSLISGNVYSTLREKCPY